MNQDLAKKRAVITKLGTPVLAWGRTRGAVLGEEEDNANHFRVSLHDSGSNWVDVIHIDNIEVDDGVYRGPSTKNEVIEIEDESCGSGGCKI